MSLSSSTLSSSALASSHAGLPLEEVLAAPVAALAGITTRAATVLAALGVATVFDLATAPAFRAATEIAEHDGTGLIAAGLLDNGLREAKDPALLPTDALIAVDPPLAGQLTEHLGVATIADLANWPPAVAARSFAGVGVVEAVGDPEIPDSLVPKLNEFATEKTTYSIFTVDPSGVRDAGRLALDGSLDVGSLVKHDKTAEIQTGHILRYQQTWTPMALTLGNLLHSVALAPGESTRIAMLNWNRTQSAQTTESLDQLDTLRNQLDQQRSVGEITRAIARESQEGFSRVTSNSTVSNSAYTAYGLNNAGAALGAAAAGAGAGAVGLGAAGAAAGAGIGAIAGLGIGAVPGALIGGGAGAIIGAGAGAVTGFIGAAEFGSAVDSASTNSVDVVTTTSTNGQREVESEMLQNISSRTQQHSSNSRNRRASIVQEVQQSETETVTTRVVTNYNHMHALTVQYFEVVQLYAARTRQVDSVPCIYIPVQPINWTPDLVREFRSQILGSALRADVVFSLLTTEGTATVTSPTIGAVTAATLGTDRSKRFLDAAQEELDDFVSANPDNGWRLPVDAKLKRVIGLPIHQAGPLAGQPVRTVFTVTASDGSITGWNPLGPRRADEEQDPIANTVTLSEAARIDIRIIPRQRPAAGRDDQPEVDMAQIVDAPFDWQFTVGVEVANDFGISEISMPVSVRVTPEMVDGTTITIPWIQIDQALSMRRVLKHLNDNTTHYTQAILRSGNSPLVRMMLAKLKFSAQRFGRGLADVPLADLVDPEPVAVNGLSLVFSLPSAAAKPITSETAEELVPVATGGVFAEAVQGRANSAEVIDLSRFWNWQDSPIPILPPDIAPVALGSRAQAIDLRAGSFDPSSLDLQQAPALPAAAGTSAAFGALQAQIFRDMSGLAAAAQVAQTSLQAASTSADSAGGQASENLRAGIEQTTDIIEKVADITSNFGTLLATTGFGAAGGGGGQTGGLGGLASSVGSQTSGRGAPATGTATELGGVLNRARALDQAATGATGSLSLDPTSNPVLGAAGSQPSGSLSLNPNSNPVLSRGTSQPSGSLALNPGSNPVAGLERAVLGQAAGLPVGAATQPSDETPDLPQIPPLSTILPALDAAGSSDENFRTGVQAGLRHLADLQLLGESDNEAQVIVTSKLRNAFRERVQFHVDAVNRGDESSLGPLLELAVLNQQAPDIADLDQFEIVSLLNLQISFVDVQHPPVVRGGENITVTGRVVQNGPGAFNGPAAQTAVTLLGSPSETGRAEGRTDDQGRFSLTIPHAAAPADGPDRFVAQNDMNLTLEAFSGLSPLISDTRSFVIPGELEIVVEAATFVDDESNAFFVNGRIDAQSGRTIRIDYRITVGGRPAGGRQISDADLALTGVGGNITTVSTATDGDGRIGVLYDPDGADSANGRLTLTLGEPASRKSVFVTIQLR